MKRLLLTLLAIATLSLGFPPTGKACNNSSFVLDSMVTTAGPTYTIYTTLCIGYGRTGVVFGADGPTNGFFSIAVFYPDPSAIQAALTAWTLNLVMGTAQNPTPAIPPGPVAFTADPTLGWGPLGVGWGLNNEGDNIFYGDPNCGCLDYTCIISTAACGDAGSLCQQLVFTYTGIYPDSLRALGIEGLAPFGGCWPNSDMLIDLSALPVVWGNFSGMPSNGGVNLTWDTQVENHTKEIVVTRSKGYDNGFAEIGRLNAAGNSSSMKSYTYFDANPIAGVNAYQLQQIDEDGNVNKSSVIYINYLAPGAVSLEKFFPNPVTDILNLVIHSDNDKAATLTLANAEGKIVSIKNVTLLTGINESVVSMRELAPGIYFIRIASEEGTIEKKILKY